MIKILQCIFFVSLILPFRAECQISMDQLIANTMSLEVTMTLDRSVYFAGEGARVDVKVKNPTASPLQVLEPFRTGTGCFNLLEADAGTYRNAAPEPLCIDITLNSSTPTTTLAPGAEMSRSLRSSDDMFNLTIPVLSRASVPFDAGSYALEYTYLKSVRFPFTVVAPKVEASASAQTPAVSYVDSVTGQTKQVPTYAHVFALRWENRSYLCVTNTKRRIPDLLEGDANGNLSSGRAMEVNNFRRVEGQTSDLPITSVTAAADAGGNLSVVWRDAGGTDHNVYIPAN